MYETYGELVTQVDALQHVLAQRGLDPLELPLEGVNTDVEVVVNLKNGTTGDSYRAMSSAACTPDILVSYPFISSSPLFHPSLWLR